MSTLSEEKIKDAIAEAFKDMPYMEQISPGLWKISSGGKNPTIMYTGDGGADDFRKAMKETALKFKQDDQGEIQVAGD